MTVDKFTEILNSHLPETLKDTKFKVSDEVREDGAFLLTNDRDNIRVFVGLHEDEVFESTLVTSGVPFLGITPTEMLEHATETLIVSAALIQTFTDPGNTVDYSQSKTILKILGFLNKGDLGSINKSYQRDDIRYIAKATRGRGTISLGIIKKGLTN